MKKFIFFILILLTTLIFSGCYISSNLGSPIYYVLKTPNGRIVFEKTKINYYYWDNRVIGEIIANSNFNE